MFLLINLDNLALIFNVMVIQAEASMPFCKCCIVSTFGRYLSEQGQRYKLPGGSKMSKRRGNFYLAGLLLALAGVLGGCVATMFVAVETVVYVKTDRQTSATVNLDADADKVYQTALNMINKNPKLLITSQADASRYVEFAEAEKSASLRIVPISEGKSQLTITSASPIVKQSTTNMVLMAVEKICNEMNVSYRVVNE